MALLMVVDDDVDVRRMLATVLKSRGHEVVEAGDGAQALGLARRLHPSVILSDILMPTMDGYEFGRQLRDDAVTAQIPVIFLSAEYNGRAGDDLARAIGVASVLHKPCDPRDILSAVDHALSGEGVRKTDETTASFNVRHLRVMTDKLSEKASMLQAANARLAALCQLNLQVAADSDLGSMCDRVSRGMRELFAARYAAIQVAPSMPAGPPLARYSGLSPVQAARLDAVVGTEAPFVGALQQRRTQRLEMPSGVARALGLQPGDAEQHSLLVAPVQSQAHSFGWLCVIDKIGDEPFDAEDERALSMLAAQVCSNLEINAHAAQLQREVRERTLAGQRIEHLNRVYAVLSSINALIVRVRDRQQLFADTCRLSVEEGRFRASWIVTYDVGAGTLTGVALAGSDSRVSARLGQSFKLESIGGRRLVREALETRQPAVCNDVQAEAAELALGEHFIAEGYRSIAALPLMMADQVFAVLFLSSIERGFFNAEEMRLLSELAADVGFACDHLAKTERLDYLAYYDSLTGLANGTLMRQRLAQNIGDAERGGARLALVVIDIDRLEMINESFGRGVGDQVLKKIAERLSHCIGDDSRIARVGADEFGVVVPDVRSESEVAREVESWVRRMFDEPIPANALELNITGKAGVTLYPVDAPDADGLLSCARAALKRSKSTTDAFLFYKQDMSERTAERLALEVKVRRGLENREFVLHYQPKVHALTGHLVGLEALMRWHSPELGMVPPSKFISLMEETGMIVDAGRWALRQALDDRARWLSLGLAAPRVAINVSTIEVRRRDFVRAFADQLAGAGQEPGIDIEVTESLIMEDIGSNIEKLAALRELGVQIGIDDFGTGYSSLAYLARLPVSALKIDRGFIGAMCSDQATMTLVSTIVSLGQSLRLTVIAEGVETEQQATILRQLQCHQLQGYLFGKPQSFEDISARIAGGAG